MRDLTNYCERRNTARQLRRTQTKAELKLWECLRGRRLDNLKFRRQFPLDRFFADFCCLEKKLIVEVDGIPHADKKEEDSERTLFLAEQGFRVIRFWNDEILRGADSVCKKILNEAKNTPHASPLQEGEGGEGPGEAKIC